MTKDEAIKIAEVLSGVDGGCPCCIEGACDEMTERFPEWRWQRCPDEDHYGCVVIEGIHVSDD